MLLSTWLKSSSRVLLLMGLVTCSGQQQGDTVAQRGSVPGADVDDDDDDFDVVVPVPMALTDPSLLAEANRNGLNGATAAGSFSSEGAKNDVDKLINPLNTTREVDENGDLMEYPNFDISYNILSIPGYAGGEMKKLLTSVLEVSNQLFGANGYFGLGDYETKKAITLFEVSDGTSSAVPHFAELVVRDAELELFRVNLYFRIASNQWELRTIVDFQPDPADKQFALVKLQHSAMPIGSVTREYIVVEYETRTKIFVATFGTSPVDTTIPAKTIISMQLGDDTVSLQGAYVWKNALVKPPENALPPPRYYKPITEDISLFNAVTRISDDAETVQQIAFIPKPEDAVQTYATTSTIFAYGNDGYAKDQVDYLVSILRNEGVNPVCNITGDQIRGGFTDNNKTMPQEVADAPADLCASNTAFSDDEVATVLRKSCENITLNMFLNVQADGGEVEKLTVNLCAKLIEAYLLLNNKYLAFEPLEQPDGSVRRQRYIILDDYTSYQELVSVVYAQEAPNSVFATLEDELNELSPLDISPLATLSWPEVVTQQADYFVGALQGI